MSDGSMILILGGLLPTGTTGAILRYDPTTSRTTSIGKLATPVHDAAGVALSGSILVFGGGRSVPESAVQRAAVGGRTTVVGRLPGPRADLGAVAIGTMGMVLGGGISGTLDRAVLGTMDGATFRGIATLTYGVRYAASVAHAGFAYVIGGAGVSGDRTDIQRVDPASGAVDVVAQLPMPIAHASAFVLGGHLLIAGGISNGTLQDAIWEFDPATGAVDQVGHLPRPLSDFAVTVVGNVAYVFGGETNRRVASIVTIAIR